MINRLGAAIQPCSLAARLAFSGVLGIAPSSTRAQAHTPSYTETGFASWYGGEFAGRPTACGEVFDPTALTAAHLSLPFGTLVRITNLSNGRSTVARINDRGPFAGDVILDCSRAVATVLGFVREGVTQVRITCAEASALSQEEAVASTNAPSRVALAGVGVPAGGEAFAAAVPGPPPAKTASGFCVQIGAYREPSYADTQLRKASLLSVPAFVHQTKRFFHVLVGPFADRSRAIETLAKLQHAGVTGYVRTFAQ